MKIRKATFEGKHNGQAASVRFEPLDGNRQRVNVRIGRREQVLTIASGVRPCVTNAGLLVDMFAGSAEATVKRLRQNRRKAVSR